MDSTPEILGTVGPACPVPWCDAHGVHQGHESAPVAIPGGPLAAYLTDLSGEAPVRAAVDAGGGAWTDLNAEQLRAQAAKVRAHCDRLDAMADELAVIEAVQGGGR
ncbi:hypothetical protein [Streptomyces sp. Z26]|uniref:hypothetical protein n=1 Tax=Streptomyces sp. Z26 TaxID=2500177 RepID=UPI000EF163BB|nr:hypothetical protein [Streptomyces sp. Z26]RLL67012.1 hypothetical protein D7M15_09190 [Streptomyces sp. Z26]